MTLKVRDKTCGPYPVDYLVGHCTALVMFSSAFGGINDAAWIADAGLWAVCVDNDKQRLEEMRDEYPESWLFRWEDAYEYPRYHRQRFDVVSLDPFTNEFQKCADQIEDWCRLARHVVILGTGAYTSVQPPQGWRQAARIFRTTYQGGVYWTVLERA